MHSDVQPMKGKIIPNFMWCTLDEIQDWRKQTNLRSRFRWRWHAQLEYDFWHGVGLLTEHRYSTRVFEQFKPWMLLMPFFRTQTLAKWNNGICDDDVYWMTPYDDDMMYILWWRYDDALQSMIWWHIWRCMQPYNDDSCFYVMMDTSPWYDHDNWMMHPMMMMAFFMHTPLRWWCFDLIHTVWCKQTVTAIHMTVTAVWYDMTNDSDRLMTLTMRCLTDWIWHVDWWGFLSRG